MLEAAFPGIIKRNLGDTPDAEKLPRCMAYARTVLLEYNNNTPSFVSSSDEPDKPRDKTNKQAGMSGERFDPIGDEIDAEETRGKLECLRDCKTKLSPRDSEVLDKYFTGITIRDSEDDALTDRAIKALRKILPTLFGVAPDTIRPNVFRSKEKVFKCVEKCLKRQEKK